MNKSPCAEVRQLNVRRGKSMVLDQVDFSLEPGRIVGLLGPSGSGKSTLMRAIVGNQIIAGGEVNVLGNRAGHRSLRHRVGYMTQAASVYDDLTVQQNISYFARILGQPDSEVQRVLDITDLGGQAQSLALDLSGGQRNRVSLAVALLGSPDIVILDEPTVGLDPVLRADLWHIFGTLAAEGMCLLVSSHVMDEAMRCDEILLLRDGRLLAQLTPTQLLERTGASDPEDAFLRLIAADQSDTSSDSDGPIPHTMPTTPRHRATPERTEQGEDS